MKTVKKDMFVSLDFTTRLENGDILDTTLGHMPLEIQIGAGNITKNVEDALIGMKLNDARTITFSPEEAYGKRHEDAVHTFSKDEIPSKVNPEVDQIITVSTPDGQQVNARITHVDDNEVVVDMNHPLAGKTLLYDIQIVNISETPTQAPSEYDYDSGADQSRKFGWS